MRTLHHTIVRMCGALFAVSVLPALVSCATPGGADVDEVTSSPPSVAQVQGDMKKSLESMDQHQKDRWFVSNIAASGVDMGEEKALELRGKTCDSLRQGVSLTGVSRMFVGYTEEQVGAFVGSSMLSLCPDVTISVEGGAP